MTQVDTARVTGRRQLGFETIDQVLVDVDRLVEAERAGRLTRLGNWTLGQTLGHLATWAEFAYTENPMRPPWFVRIMSRMMKKRFIYGPMRSGFRIPRIEGGTLGTDDLPTSVAEPRLRAVFERLKHEPPTKPSSVFGPLTQDEAINLNLRHAELHLSFLRAD
jgi:hypothetical protein